MWAANAPALLLLLPCSCIAPGLLLACSQPAPGLLVVCSCFAPETAHPTFAAFIIISTLQLFSARREPPFMVLGQPEAEIAQLDAQMGQPYAQMGQLDV